MSYLDYANSTSHGIEVLAIVAGIYFKAYRTKFGLLLFILPLSSFIADSIILYSSLPYYMPIGTMWQLFHLFNILAIFYFIRVFSKKEITLFFLLNVLLSIFLVIQIIASFETKLFHFGAVNGFSSLYLTLVGFIACYHLFQKVAKEGEDVSFYFQAIVSITLFNLIIISPQFLVHLLLNKFVDQQFCQIVLIWMPIGNIIRNLMLTHLFYLRRNVTA
jgi:hypothetical protein